MSKCFNQIYHEALLNKLEALPSLAKQVKACLNVDHMTRLRNDSESAIIRNMVTWEDVSQLLAKIVFYGMETALTKWLLKAYPKEPIAIQVRCANDFVILHQSRSS